MQRATNHNQIISFIWNVANKLRGPYRPPQYRRVMLPMIVLRRFDLVLSENKEKVLAEKERLEAKGVTGPALEKALSRIAATDRKQELFNTSGFTFEKLLGDAPNIAGNLIAYIQGFSPRARDIFDKFEFEAEISKLDEANRLFLIIKEFCSSEIDLSTHAISNLIYGDTLGIKDAKNKNNGFVPNDGHPDKKFHYMLANPPFGVEWKPEEDFVKEEYKNLGFSGRFGAGLPRINDGSLLFLQHMISKMHQPPKVGGDGSKIGIVFNGSPLFTGDAGSGESNIRRWIIENDMLDAIIALPDQMFYNTGIYTYVWLVTNKKKEYRKGKIQLIDGTRHFKKMDKSLGNKRHEMSPDHIAEIVRLYAENDHDAESTVIIDGNPQQRICSKIFNNREFGFLKMTVERPLRLNFQCSPDRISRLSEQRAFANLATSKKRKDAAKQREEVEAGQKLQARIKSVLEGLDAGILYHNRDKFLKALNTALKKADIKIAAPVKKAILAALSERDPDADTCTDTKGNPEPDSELRDTELVPLPSDIQLPLPLGYDNETNHDKLLDLVTDHCERYLQAEVLPHVPDAWIDHSKTKVGYEIPLTRQFYVYQPPRPLEVIAQEISQLEKEIVSMLREVL